MTKRFYSNGKLLLTGEYGVLDGALSLAIPTKYGQSLTITENNSKTLHWLSFNEKAEIWFEGDFDSKNLKIVKSTNKETAETLVNILEEARKLNPEFIDATIGYDIRTELNFSRNWGLGTSSTLINNIAEWANVDPYILLWNSFAGSGYDIACARNNTPILYKIVGEKPVVKAIVFNPPFKDAIYFIHLNKKQNSREGIEAYRKAHFNKAEFVSEINTITNEISICNDLEKFRKLVFQHEVTVGEVLNQTPLRQRLFTDYEGEIKSLGAWGGDFIMAVGPASTPEYFKKKGYKTSIPYSNMVL